MPKSLLVQGLAAAQHAQHLLQVARLATLGLLPLGPVHHPAAFVEVLQLELLLKVLVMLLPLDLAQHCLLNERGTVLGFCQCDLLDVSLEFLLVVGVAHLVHIISEELLLQDLEDGRQHLDGLGGGAAVGDEPEVDAVHEHLFAVCAVLLHQHAEV